MMVCLLRTASVRSTAQLAVLRDFFPLVCENYGWTHYQTYALALQYCGSLEEIADRPLVRRLWQHCVASCGDKGLGLLQKVCRGGRYVLTMNLVMACEKGAARCGMCSNETQALRNRAGRGGGCYLCTGCTLSAAVRG